ncbi:MAG TPA: hypothetical protein PL193_07525 [Xanthobacteraceae bacterium]|nr:hypothetical protein [Xanthobacteraceae bacterium]
MSSKLTRAAAAAAVGYLQGALNDGFSPNGKPSATFEALRRYNAANPKAKLHRASFVQRIDRAKELFGLAAKAPANAPQARAGDPGFSLGGTPQDRTIVRQTDEINRLREALKEAHRSEIDAEETKRILGVLGSTPASPPDWLLRVSKAGDGIETPMTMWADWHAGEVVDPAQVGGVNEFNLSILDRRVKTLVEKTFELCRNHHGKKYPGIVVALTGDFVSGGLHPELQKTDELDVLPAALHVRDLLVRALTDMADEFGSVYCPAVCGNHGRGTLKPEFKDYLHKNYDWLIYQLLIRHFERDPRVTIDVRATNDVSFRVFGRRFLLMHGDMLGVKGGDGIIGALGPIMRGRVKVGMQAAALGQDFDHLMIGHWHQEIALPSITVSNTLKGFDEFAMSALRALPSLPSQPLWFEHPEYGRTSYWNVRLEKPKKISQEWVSIPKVAA